MKNIIRLVVLIVLSFGISGCTPSFEPHQPTIDYAKKHNLKNKDYLKSKIMCITNKPLSSKDMSELMSIIMSKMSKFWIDPE